GADDRTPRAGGRLRGRRAAGRDVRRALLLIMRARTAMAAAGTVVLLASAAPAAAGAARVAPVNRGAPATTGAATGAVRDRVIARRSPRARAAVGVGATHAYRTADGVSIEVQLSQSFADTEENRAGAQSSRDLLATRLHGSAVGK